MMELTKRKFTRLTKFLLLAVIIISCNYNLKKEDRLLECILNSYIKNSNISKGDMISIHYKTNWTDSTSIAVISNHRFSEDKKKKIFRSSYNDIKIHLIIDDSSNIDNESNLDFLIPNNLVWKVKESGEEKKTDYMLDDYEELNNIQIVYNVNKKCIQKIIVGPKTLINNIYEKCDVCGSSQ